MRFVQEKLRHLKTTISFVHFSAYECFLILKDVPVHVLHLRSVVCPSLFCSAGRISYELERIKGNCD